MRPQQQNRRMRGRNNNNNNNNNNNRKGGPNPLTRSYESNGPDVKIRGNAQQIADKYMQLARDAQGSGDRVMAENYLQHAEHYNRIIAAAQAQMPVQVPRDNRDDLDDDEEGGFDGQPNVEPQVNDGTGPQPDISGMPGEATQVAEADGGEQPREDQQANGEEGGGQRRSRRQRRRNPRSERDGDGEAGADAQANGDAAEATAGAGDQVSAPTSEAPKDVSEPAE